MTLKEWKQRMFRDIKAFEDEWQESCESEPDLYPRDMEPASWDEHFEIFQETMDAVQLVKCDHGDACPGHVSPDDRPCCYGKEEDCDH